MKTALAVMVAVSVASFAMTSVVPATAQTDQPRVVSKKKTGKPVAAYGRPPTRVTVRRPFTDPGTETLPLDQHYHDYAFSPTYTPYPNQGGIVGFSRSPLPSAIDLPGLYNFGF